MRILIVAWAWPPIGRVGALRPMGFAREWTRMGCEVHVLTGPGDRGGEFSPDLVARAEESGATIHRAAAPEILAMDLTPSFQSKPQALVARPISRWRQVLAQWRTFPDYQRSWIPHALRVARGLHAAQPMDVVLSTSPPESVHYVARGLADAGLPWVADFRDQWSDYLLARWDPLSRWLIDRLTRRILGAANAVTANTDGVARSIARAGGRLVPTVRNGFDPVESRCRPVRVRTLGYFGRIDPTLQRPDRLWPALRALRDRGQPWNVEFYLTPGGGGGAAVRVPPDLTPFVCVRPPLPHAEALAMMQEMTANLLLCWETREGDSSVGGKLYEYVGGGRPVLVCAPRGFEARTLVDETQTGVGAWGDEELTAAFGALETYVPSSAGRERLSRRNAALEMMAVLKAAATKPGVPGWP